MSILTQPQIEKQITATRHKQGKVLTEVWAVRDPLSENEVALDIVLKVSFPELVGKMSHDRRWIRTYTIHDSKESASQDAASRIKEAKRGKVAASPTEDMLRDVISFLERARYNGGRALDVTRYPNMDRGSKAFISVDPSNRERIDDYEKVPYDEGDPYDYRAYGQRYAGPMSEKVQDQLDARFGKGTCEVGIGEKGHVDVYVDVAKLAKAKKASILTQPLALRHDYGYIYDLSKDTSRLPGDVAITAGEEMSGNNHAADSDGSYMSVGYLKALAAKSHHLLDHIHYDTPLPDWVEAKIGVAANAINAVFDYFEFRGDENQEETMSLESQYTLLPQAVTAKFKKDVKMTVDEVAKVVGPEFKEMNENPPPEVVKVRDEMGKKAGRKVAVGDIPADVERYVKEIEKSNPDYDEAQTWATAWSIYCKYKEPGSEHCSMPASGYFTKQACGEDGFEGWGETLMADWEEGSVISPPTSGPGTPYTEMWGSDTPDGVGNVLKRADEVDPLMAGLEFMAEGCPDNLDEAGCEEWEANTEKYKDVVKDLHKAAADALKLADSFKVAKPLRERLTDRQRKLAAEIESCLADDGVMAEGLDDACWEGYEAVGMKVQGGKEVPNCVPVGKQANNLPATVQGWLEWED